MAQETEQLMQVDGAEVLVVRSARRRRTVSADQIEGRLRLRVPARISHHELTRHVRAFRRRMDARSSTAGRSDEDLMRRARQLSRKYLNSAAHPNAVSWSAAQHRRWGSTTSTTGTIRLSARLRQMPDWVVDAVLVHELAHLIEPGHGPRFRELIADFPRTEEADAFLAGVTWADQHGRPAP